MSIINEQSIDALRSRALSLMPRGGGVVATDKGWEKRNNRGGAELLVSFPGLSSILGQQDIVVPVASVVEPVEAVVAEPVAPVVVAEEVKIEPVPETPVVSSETPKE
jgi:hypothetical protein